MNLEQALGECPVVAILRGVRPDEVLAHVEALLDAGVHGVEVPLNSPEPLVSIQRVAQAFGDRMAVGAGTVLTSAAVDTVAEAGGRLVIAPNTEPAVIARSVALGLDPIPGFATPSEAFTACAAGARHLKLFPAVTYGPGYVRQLKAVLPADVRVWAVGGVGPATLAEWWAAGVRAFGLGGELYRAGQSAEDTARKAAAAVAAAGALDGR